MSFLEHGVITDSTEIVLSERDNESLQEFPSTSHTLEVENQHGCPIKCCGFKSISLKLLTDHKNSEHLEVVDRPIRVG